MEWSCSTRSIFRGNSCWQFSPPSAAAKGSSSRSARLNQPAVHSSPPVPCSVKMVLRGKVSVVQFQRKLDLARRPGGLADHTKPAAENNVGGQTEIHFVEDIEELSSKLKDREFAVSAMAEGGVLNQGEIEIAEAGTSKRATAKNAKTALVRARSAGNVEGDLEKRAVRSVHAEVVLAHRPARGKIRHGE